MRDGIRVVVILAMVLACGTRVRSETQADQQAQFEQLRRRIQREPSAVQEETFRSFIGLANELLRPASASAAARGYLAARRDASPALWRLAGDVAFAAGDLRTAELRYREYLLVASPGPETSEVAARVAAILVDYLDRSDEAYRFLAEAGRTYRQALVMRRFDRWFLDEGMRRNDFENVAERIATLLEEKLRPEWVDFHLGRHLHWLMSEITKAQSEHYAAAAAVRRIASQLPGNAERSAEYRFFAENLAFHATSAGQSEDEREASFRAVADAARQYVDVAPTAEVVQKIMRVFGGGLERAHDNSWNAQVEQKREVFVYAFNKVSDRDRQTLMGWRWWNMHQRVASREQWAELGRKHPALFAATSATAHLPFVLRAPTVTPFTQQAAFLKGVPSHDAATIQSLAAAGTGDLLAGVRHLVEAQSWHLEPADVWNLYLNHIRPVFLGYERAESSALPDGYIDGVQYEMGRNLFAASVWPLLHPQVGAVLLQSAWAHSGRVEAGRSLFIEALQSLDWVPFDADQRKLVYDPAFREYERWSQSRRENATRLAAAAQTAVEAVEAAEAAVTAAEVAHRVAQDALSGLAVAGEGEEADAARAQRAEKEKALQEQVAGLTAAKTALATAANAESAAQATLLEAQADVALAEEIATAFQRAFDPDPAHRAAAPNPVAAALSRATIAARTQDADAWLAASRETYSALRAYETAHSAFGRATVAHLLRMNPGRDSIDFQIELVIDQLKRIDPSAANLSANWTMQAMVQARGWDWRHRQLPQADRENVLKLNDALAAVLQEQIAADQFWPSAFYWFRITRLGSGWHASDRNTEVLAGMIEARTLLQPGSPRFHHTGAVPSYQWLIRNEFQPLDASYPVNGGLDDLFVEEIESGADIDMAFFQYSQDRDRKASDAITRRFAQIDRPPFHDDLSQYNDFFQIQARIWQASPEVREVALEQLHSYFGKTRFDDLTTGRHLFNALPVPDSPEARKAFLEALEAYLVRVAPLPWRATPVQITSQHLTGLGGTTDLDDDAYALILRIFSETEPWTWPRGQHFEALALAMVDRAVTPERLRMLLPQFATLWKIGRDTGDGRYMDELGRRAGDLGQSGSQETGAALADLGISMLGTRLSEGLRTTLQAVRASSLATASSLISIERADPRYPVYAAQAAFAQGQFEQAWTEYRRHRNLALQELTQLNPRFLLWVIEQHTGLREFAYAEALVQPLLQWMDSTPRAFEPEARAGLLLRVADISFARQDYPRARAQYERLALATDLSGTLAQRDAELRMAEVDRATRNYDRAVQHLERLLVRRDAYLQTQAHYQLARIRYDQEDYVEAREHLDQVFAVNANHAQGRILEGELYLRMRKLVEATDVRVGLASDQETILPGRPLRVQIEDRTLAVVGTALMVEIRAWTDSGDEEFFHLMPFGDSRTRFEGEIPTELGAPRKGDRTLQVLGGDTVYYNFSERFRKANHIEEQPSAAIQVVSDAELFVSSGDLPDEDAREREVLERLARERIREREEQVALSVVRGKNEVKPGQPIYVRVVDPDRSVSAEPDVIFVQASTASGDRVDRVPLKETGPHTGIFEGEIPTAHAPATAFASDSTEGRDPNFVITEVEYPAWIGLGDNRRPKFFSVDLNSSAALNEMEIRADEPLRRLRRFLVQTSMNGRDFVNIGLWPEGLDAWESGLRLEVAPLAGQLRVPDSVDTLREYLDLQTYVQGTPRVVQRVNRAGVDWDASLGGLASELQLPEAAGEEWYVGRISGMFFQPQRRQRTFRIELERGSQATLFLTVNGEEAPSDGSDFVQILPGGLHRLDVWFAAPRAEALRWTLLCDSPEPPYMQPCPPEMFEEELDGLAEALFATATIEADDRGEVFQVAFPAGVQARMVRLALLDFERDAPAIRRIRLTDMDDEVILPTTEDVVQLRHNDTLEIIPGDTISVVYEDPTFVNPSRQVRQAQLRATFYDATISACFVESIVDAHGNRHPFYVPMRRYRPGDTVSVFIYDPDMDISPERDRVRFRAQTVGGQSVELEALETGEHTGTFIGTVFPVDREPERGSEIRVGPGEDLILIYRDEENTNPGIPWDRRSVVEPVTPLQPRLHVYDVQSRPLTAQEQASLPPPPPRRRGADEVVPVTHSLTLQFPEEGAESMGMHGVPLIVEVIYPSIAQSPQSQAELFVQAESARRKQGVAADAPFDVDLPGTIRLQRTPGFVQQPSAPRGFLRAQVRGQAQAGDPLDDGRFTFVVPFQLDRIPEQSFSEVLAADLREGTIPSSLATEPVHLQVLRVTGDGSMRYEQRVVQAPVLSVRGTDTIHVGFRWEDADGREQWLTQQVALLGDIRLDVMDQRYQQPIERLFVGERLFLRLIDPIRDVSEARDEVEIEAITEAGERHVIGLMETHETSGIFKGMVQLVFEGDPSQGESNWQVPVAYGDRVRFRYTLGPDEFIERVVNVHLGADGQVLPFTKRFADPEMAVQTQFTIAEAYFEQAKNYRALEQHDLARSVIAQGRRLLEEAVRDHPTSAARAQADYLLAELVLESAEEAVDADEEESFLLEAISRFSELVARYPDSAYAPRSQYKTALTYERLGQMDQASEEYVKLAYRYPDHELVAETIARLGQYFLTKGREMQDLVQQESDPLERAKLEVRMLEMFRTSGEVFGRLSEHFPDHALAVRTLVLSGQSFMRAEDLSRAIAVFESVIEARAGEPDMIAQAMYWAADSYLKTNAMVDAYRMFRRLTWDYPESQWARFARGRLTEPAMIRVESQESR